MGSHVQFDFREPPGAVERPPETSRAEYDSVSAADGSPISARQSRTLAPPPTARGGRPFPSRSDDRFNPIRSGNLQDPPTWQAYIPQVRGRDRHRATRPSPGRTEYVEGEHQRVIRSWRSHLVKASPGGRRPAEEPSPTASRVRSDRRPQCPRCVTHRRAVQQRAGCTPRSPMRNSAGTVPGGAGPADRLDSSVRIGGRGQASVHLSSTGRPRVTHRCPRRDPGQPQAASPVQ